MSFCCRGSRISFSSFLWCRFNKGHQEDDFPTLSTALSQIQKRSIDHLMAGLIPQHTCCHTPRTWCTADIWTFHQLLQDNLYSLAAAALIKGLIRTLMIDTRLSPLMHSSAVFTSSECVPAMTHSQRRPKQEALGIVTTCPSAEPGLRLVSALLSHVNTLILHLDVLPVQPFNWDPVRLYPWRPLENTSDFKGLKYCSVETVTARQPVLPTVTPSSFGCDITTEGWWKDELSDLKQPPGTTVSLQREKPLSGVHT